jgi:hypothetical protein
MRVNHDATPQPLKRFNGTQTFAPDVCEGFAGFRFDGNQFRTSD